MPQYCVDVMVSTQYRFYVEAASETEAREKGVQLYNDASVVELACHVKDDSIDGTFATEIE